MPAQRVVVELIAREPLSSRVHRLRFASRAPFAWAAGQHLVVVRGQGQALFLPYSIASANDPEKPGEFELAVAMHAGADVMDTLPVGAELEVEGPAGAFTWQPAPRPAALLVGAGTGIAPLRALIEAELARAGETRLLLLAGHREPEDVLFADDFARLAAAHSRFHFIPTLSGGSSAWLRSTRPRPGATAGGGELTRSARRLRLRAPRNGERGRAAAHRTRRSGSAHP